MSWSATAPTSRKLPPSWGLWVLWGPSWARCWRWAPFGPALRRSVPGGCGAPRTLGTEPTESLAAGFMLSLVLPAVGWLLFAMAALRARVYPRATTMILFIGAIVGFLPLPLTELVLNVAVAWLSLTLLWGRGAAAAPTTAEAQPRVYCVLRDYLSRRIVTGP